MNFLNTCEIRGYWRRSREKSSSYEKNREKSRFCPWKNKTRRGERSEFHGAFCFFTGKIETFRDFSSKNEIFWGDASNNSCYSIVACFFKDWGCWTKQRGVVPLELTHHFWGESTNRNHIMHGEILASVILSSVDSHLTCYCRWQKNNLLAMTGGGWAEWRSFAAATRWEISCCLNFVHHTDGRCICFAEFWSTRSDDTLPGGCWLKRCLRQSRRTFTMCIVRHHFCSAVAFYFSELLCVIAFNHPSHCACVDWVEYCLIMMFIVTNFGNAKHTI
jgi:hypothetical protein